MLINRRRHAARERHTLLARASMAGAPSGPTLVFMPFANLGEGPEARIYAQGLTEEGLGQLARFKELSVLGRETSRSIPLDADVARIRRDLDVRYVLEGSVRTAAHQFRVVSRLLDAETGAVLWSQAYDDDLASAASLRSRMTWRRRRAG